MNFVYFSPNFPTYYWNFCDRLKKMRVNVFGIGDTPYDQLNDNMKNALTEYYKVDNLENYDESLRGVGYLTHKYGKIDCLDSQNEHWLSSDAKLRTDFNIFGTKSSDVMYIKRKSLMKEKFKKAGVPSGRFTLVTNINDAKKFITKVGYPVIVKPDIGVGASSTYPLHHDDDLKNFFNSNLQVQYLMEELITGFIETFDGITDRSGNILFATSHLFPNSVMDAVNNDDHLSFYSLREINSDISNAGKAMVEAFDTRSQFFHLEFFRLSVDKKGLGKKGEIFALEVNMRPPGCYMLDMMNYANDVDIYQMWADMIVNDKIDNTIDRKYHAGYASRKNRINYIHSHQDIINKFGDKLYFETPIEEVFARAMGNHGYVFRAAELEDVKEIIDYIQDHN